MCHVARRGWMPALLALVAACVAGCTEHHLVIEMRPAGGGFERRVTAYNIDPSDSLQRRGAPTLDSLEEVRLVRTYGVHPDTVRPYTARRHFDVIPCDIGNSGRWSRDASPLGDAYAYHERLRGDPTPGTTLALRLAAADSIAERLRRGAPAWLGPEPHHARLRAYLAGDLARELRDAVVLAWGLEATRDTGAMARFEVDQVEHPVAYELLGMTFVARLREALLAPAPIRDNLLARRHETLLRLLEGDLTAEREGHAVTGSSADRDSMERWVGTGLDDGSTSPLADDERWRALHRQLGIGTFFGGDGADNDILEVRLDTGVEPTETNGGWDAASHTVVWKGVVAGRDLGAPLVCRAVWATPDSVRQRALFGRVLLRDAGLAEYCHWYVRIPAPRRSEWDRMLTALKPGELGPLERFAFADERTRLAADSTARSAAEPARALILKAAHPGE